MLRKQSMTSRSSLLFNSLSLALLLASFEGLAGAQTLSGTLSNFDVFNDTGQVSRGFEIELHGLTSKDIAYTFGGTYIRYGNPVVTDIPGGVLVRYASAYDAAQRAFAVGTPVPAAFTATAGHQCWTGGAPGYPTSGCEHFGVGLVRSPTDVLYRWLVEDSATPGGLKASGTSVNIAAPLWGVVPGAGGAAAVVNAQIEPPRPAAQQFGDAVWVKVYESESSENVELNHLLTDDPVVPHDAGQVEVEWELSQFNPKKADHGSLGHGKSLGNGSQSVIRRFEFYKYTGGYDPESHEALCSARQGKGSDCNTPGPGELGNYIGAQMAAAQFGQPAASKSAITGISNSASGSNHISAGAWVSIYGSGLAATTRSWQAADFQGTRLPLSLDNVFVTIDNRPAAVSFISPGQINVQAPGIDSVGPVEVKVTSSLGTATGFVTMDPYSPAFFTFSGKYAAAVHLDGALVAPAGFFGAGVASRPAQPGEVLLVFGTGFGPTSPAIAAGQMVGAPAPMVASSGLRVRIGSQTATVQYAGLVAVGEYQFNIVVPALPDGDQAIVADAGGVSSAASLLIPVKN
jgi:uncharacterized protein (TIGR03437 family)